MTLYGKVSTINGGWLLRVGTSPENPYGYTQWGVTYTDTLEEAKAVWYANMEKCYANDELVILDGFSDENQGLSPWGTQRSGILD